VLWCHSKTKRGPYLPDDSRRPQLQEGQNNTCIEVEDWSELINLLIEVKRSMINDTESYGRNNGYLFSSIFISTDVLDTSNNNSNNNL
jgi:hypothetical protein